jgi:ectoine hydroxylase-related dioxygenase (phytanoyl-CoA dioxygenase family)
MDTSCLAYCLTDEERKQFNEQGYLIVEDALPPEMTERLIAATDKIHAQRRAEGLGPHESLFFPNFVWRDPAFTEIADWYKTFPKVWSILGWNIYLYHCHLGVNPPVAPDADRSKKTLGWHQDSGRVNVEMESHPRPRLSLKIGFFLTDMTEPGRGNFWVIPGSHLQDTLEKPLNGIDDPPGAMPVCVKPGTAVFFDRRLWHAASPNHSQNHTRKVLFYGYGYRWIRTKDDMTIPRELMEASDPIRKQVLGYGTNANGFFSPKDDDVPLRVWLREHRPQDAQ